MQTSGPTITRTVYVIFLLMVAFSSQTATADVTPHVTTDKEIYRAGETIRVIFSNAPGSNSDWICIVTAGSPDDEAGDYQYLPGRMSQGELTFVAPQPGKYEVRAYYNYRRNGYTVSARHSFSIMDIVAPAQPDITAHNSKPVDRATTAVPAGARRISGSVFYFTPLSMDVNNYGITITNALINAPKMQSSFAVLGRRDLEIFLAANNLQQDDQLDNMIEIGTRLGLNFVIAGSVGKKGTMIVVTGKVVSIAQRKVIFTNQLTAMGEAELINKVTKMSDSIIEAIQRSAN